MATVIAGMGAAVAAPTGAAGTAPPVAADRQIGPVRVLAISVDGFNVDSLRRLGVARTPTFHRLIAQGATTLNARTQVEMTVTLPNHTSMVTGRRIDRSHRGHGVTWNVDRRGTTVQRAAGGPVESIFSTVHAAGGESALFSTKTKFSLFTRSWPAGIDRTMIRKEDDSALVRAVRSDLTRAPRDFTFLHLGAADAAGHRFGFMSPRYLRTVAKIDRLLGSLVKKIDDTPALANTVIVLTADHGGLGKDHADPTRRVNYRVPFMVWGSGIQRADLYRLNPSYLRPGRARIGFAGKQPIRNGDLANLSASLLGLGPVPGSKWDKRQLLVATSKTAPSRAHRAVAARAATPIASTRRPRISGTARFGRTLTVGPGGWSPKPQRLRYQWLRDDRPIRGATSRRHDLRPEDVGRRLRVEVTAVRRGYAAGTVRTKLSKRVEHRVPVRRTVRYSVATRGPVSASVATFRRLAQQTYDDPRGWRGRGVRFVRVPRGGAFTLFLATPEQLPRFSSGCSAQYSCRVGRNVIINQLRWLHASPAWNGAGRSLRDYRHMVVNHETGHWLGFGHASCPGRGRQAPVMMQQSKGTQGCRLNPWPTLGELGAGRAARPVATRVDVE